MYVGARFGKESGALDGISCSIFVLEGLKHGKKAAEIRFGFIIVIKSRKEGNRSENEPVDKEILDRNEPRSTTVDYYTGVPGRPGRCWCVAWTRWVVY